MPKTKVNRRRATWGDWSCFGCGEEIELDEEYRLVRVQELTEPETAEGCKRWQWVQKRIHVGC
jgi:hypothetical protein